MSHKLRRRGGNVGYVGLLVCRSCRSFSRRCFCLVTESHRQVLQQSLLVDVFVLLPNHIDKFRKNVFAVFVSFITSPRRHLNRIAVHGSDFGPSHDCAAQHSRL